MFPFDTRKPLELLHQFTHSAVRCPLGLASLRRRLPCEQLSIGEEELPATQAKRAIIAMRCGLHLNAVARWLYTNLRHLSSFTFDTSHDREHSVQLVLNKRELDDLSCWLLHEPEILMLLRHELGTLWQPYMQFVQLQHLAVTAHRCDSGVPVLFSGLYFCRHVSCMKQRSPWPLSHL